MKRNKTLHKDHTLANAFNRLRRFVFSRVFIVIILIIVEIIALLTAVTYISQWFKFLYAALYILGICVVVYLVNKQGNPTYRMYWIIAAAAFPIFGLILYLVFGIARVQPKFRRERLESITKYKPVLARVENDLESLKAKDIDAYKQASYIWNYSYFPIHGHSELTYLNSGEAFYKALLAELEKAQKFIYIEIFIIKEGKMFDDVLEILKRKASQGVDVRIIYDDAGTAMYLPAGYYKRLQKYGIKCQVFNPLRPVLLVTMNNRDHRKVIVIDGITSFTGGMNLADEYINLEQPFGHWKDAGVMMKGEATANMQIMFLQFWQSEDEERIPDSWPVPQPAARTDSDGYILPFSDSPTDNEDIALNTHLNMIWNAKKYVWIMTPYFVVGDDLLGAILQAAKNGIDVRIITPSIPDKWSVLELTRSSYPALLKAGVKVYEYTPGFIHSKVVLTDSQTAIVGSINMDFRSYFLDFEDGVFMYNIDAINDIEKDFKETFSCSRLITLTDCAEVPWWKMAIRAVLRLIAPLI